MYLKSKTELCRNCEAMGAYGCRAEEQEIMFTVSEDVKEHERDYNKIILKADNDNLGRCGIYNDEIKCLVTEGLYDTLVLIDSSILSKYNILT